MASLSLENVRKTYRGNVQIVKGVNLEVKDGELVTLVGPSGCGKSTLLNLIAGLDTPTEGSLKLDGVDVTGASPGDRDIALVFQSYALYPHLNVRKNLEFPLRVAKLDEATIGQRVSQTAERLQLGPLLGRKPAELSGGQRQRVALGRALVRRPKLFLFDEPLSNLDAALRAQMRVEIKKLHEELKATFIYVTHDQAEAMTLSDRVAVLHEGTLQQVAPPLEIYERPANTFVATFVGSPKMNLFPGDALELPPGNYGLRPEHLEVTMAGGGLGQGTQARSSGPGLVATVYASEPLGSETWVTVECRGQRLTGRCPGDHVPASGSQVGLAFDRSRLHRFDERGLRMPTA
jgi:multiple sugar transport system ATP-binding protein